MVYIGTIFLIIAIVIFGTQVFKGGNHNYRDDD